MTQEEAKKYIKDHAKDILQPDKSKQGYICPICGSGSGDKGTGITTKDGTHFTCWAGCFTHSDFIDIVGQRDGLTEYRDKLDAACREAGIAIDEHFSYRQTKAQGEYAGMKAKRNQPETDQGGYTHSDTHITVCTHTKGKEVDADYTAYYALCHSRIASTDYPQKRGLSADVIERFNIGFDPAWKNPITVAKGKNPPPTPRLIIPTSASSYVARDTRTEMPEYQQSFSKQKVGGAHLLNLEAIDDTEKPCFVVEGEIDALSIVEVGGNAVALGGTSNVTKLIKALEGRKSTQPIIIAMDNDEAGERAAKALEEGLQKQGVSCYRYNPYKDHKDANEALLHDREALKASVEQAESNIADEQAADREALKREAVAYSLQDFLKNVEESKRAAFIPTGFSPLDSILDGGLYAGLYIVGAISSLGKTTFCLQIADQVAQAGHDVIVFSLEMARNELIAKSISRLTYIKAIEDDGESTNAKTTRGVLTGTRYARYSPTEMELIKRSVASYGEYARNIYIKEGIGNYDAMKIREEVKKHVTITGKAPVVVIDYLQIIAPADVRATDKTNTDKAVLELKRLSRDYSIPIIGISSFNRDNYTAPVNMASFKESGAIEYSSDVLIGLQYDGMDYREGETDKAREKRIRELMSKVVEAGRAGDFQRIQVKVLKHRNGSKGDAYLDFYPMFNFFAVPKDETAAISSDNGGGWRKVEGRYGSKAKQ